MKDKKRIRNLILGPALFLILLFIIPDSLFNYNSRVCIGMVVWLIYWWVALPVGPGVTALVPLAVNALFNIVPMSGVISQYMNSTVLLVFAASILSISWSETGLDRRMSLKFLCLFGTSTSGQITAWFLVSAILSTVLPNIPVVALLLPIAAAMLKQCGHEDIANSKLGSMILCLVAYGACVGGMGTPLGGSMNLIGVSGFESYTGHEFTYINWVIHVLPIMIPVIILILVLKIFTAPKGENLSGSKAFYKEKYSSLGKTTRDEWISLWLFLIPAILTFIRPVFAKQLPAAESPYLFVIFALLSFCINKKDGVPMNTWNSMSKSLSWSMIWLLGAGLAMGAIMRTAGLTDRIAELMLNSNLDGGFTTVLLFVVMTVLLAELIGNAVAAAIMIPIVASVCNRLGLSPVPYMYILIPAYNTAFALPTSIRSLPLAYGVTPKSIAQNGIIQSILVTILITLVGYALLRLAPGWYSIA